MSSRHLLLFARCGSFRPLSPNWAIGGVPVARHSGNLTTVGPCNQTRGAKSRTTIKASSLSQGALPPLPQDESEQQFERPVPTVLLQHLDNMRKFPDCIILTRVGDFYEMYYDQVEKYAPLVNLKQAKRATTRGDVPMAGFLHTQLERYLKIFVQDHGKQVAISEQIRLPGVDGPSKPGKPMYDRKVTRVITPGTLIDENFMDPYENSYLLAINWENTTPVLPTDIVVDGNVLKPHQSSMKVGLSWVDLSSGDFYTQVSDLATVPSLVARIRPQEVVIDASLEVSCRGQLQKLLEDGTHSLHFHEQQHGFTTVADWEKALVRPISDDTRGDFTTQEIAAGNLVLDYISTKLPDAKIQLEPPTRRSDDDYMAIDTQSLRGLEIRSTLRDGHFQGSLLHAVRQTVTKGGARLLSQRLVTPSMSLTIIKSRLDLVEELLNHDALREDVTALLRRTFDTRRLLQKFSIGRGDADDLLSIARTVEVMQQVAGCLRVHRKTIQRSVDDTLPARDSAFLDDILHRIDLETPLKAARKIQLAIDEEGLNRQHLVEASEEAAAEMMTEEVVNADAAGEKVPNLSRRAAHHSSREKTKPKDSAPDDIWIMRKNASETLAQAHRKLEQLLDAKHCLTLDLRSELKSESLMLKWSAQQGHFCHIKGKDTQGRLEAKSGVRVIAVTKSTRSFYLSDWTHLGGRIDDAKLRIRTEEERVFAKLRAEVLENLMKLRRNAAVLDELDVACSSANVAKQRNYVRPILNGGTSHKIFGGRHPTVDASLTDQGRPFTSNDCTVGDAERIYLITGPNMAGKSTYLRQNALITILAQTGSFVPAAYAELGLVDRIFSRIGAADNLAQAQSTFMVEMLETAEILRRATARSFVIMDEVGRGTTPEDGVAVAYACLHHLHTRNRCRALFATHFHTLADLTRDFDRLACYCTDVLEDADGAWTYVHKLRKGVNRDSHALKVARLAGMPESCVQVAGQILAELRRGQHNTMRDEKESPRIISATG